MEIAVEDGQGARAIIGTRDYGPAEIFCRAHIEKVVKDVFATFGGACLDMPVFERKDVLTDKYGEDAKLFFDLLDQSGEQLALRYDHTVPLARYLAMQGGVAPAHKLWQIGKVLDVGEFTGKLNHRKIQDGIFEVCGVPAEKIRSISSAVDKLDKMAWADVKKEMTDEKGLEGAITDKIDEHVKYKGGPDLLAKLEPDTALTGNKSAKAGISEMSILFGLLEAYGVVDKISFDLSLTRGRDYNARVIYPAILDANALLALQASNALAELFLPTLAPEISAPSTVLAPASKESRSKLTENAATRILKRTRKKATDPSISNLSFKEAKKALELLGRAPCIGVSIGMDRIFAIVWPKLVQRAGGGAGQGKQMMAHHMSSSRMASFQFSGSWTPILSVRLSELISFAVILGAVELAFGFVTVKELKQEIKDGAKTKTEGADKGMQVKRENLVRY
ncbi:hypothetical protein D9619_002357 [Psilocybe cf. subviscida]|uniref:histidine--tRNA ligase n=1 Tax=Psilocybe cf. subviscida TaxID=2480587 RepID=A0A8H5AY41_9AGAR|nr:hypothetical protein D9619_002357 [Psilocybe cf. subviscida]